MSSLAEAFAKAKAENRAALIGYLPAGYPSAQGAVEAIQAMIAGGVDIVEIGLPYSDPVMDGPTIQEAADVALAGGTRTTTVFETVQQVTASGTPTLVMSYWNPIERFGVEQFASQLHKSGGVGVITPDLTPEEACDWVGATDAANVERVFLVALSSSEERIARVAEVTSGFIYAGAVMGVTGARATLSNEVQGLVARVREHTDLPVAVGLGVSTPEQAHEIAQYADGVIVGSAFVNAVKQGGPAAAQELATRLRAGLHRE